MTIVNKDIVGCNFVCKNEQCEHVDTGFSMYSCWPLGNINDVIGVFEKNGHYEEVARYKKQKEQRMLYAPIILPNTFNIPVVAWRYQMWSQDAKCVWNYDLIEDGDGNVDLLKLPKRCPKTKCQLLNFKDVIDHGLICPKCDTALQQYRWFAKTE
jgi:hypothetical protein